MACKKGEYYCNDEQKCKPIPAGHKVLPDGELVKEGTSIIQGRTSSKKVSYRGPTAEKSKPKKSVSYRGEKDERIPRKNRHGVENKSARYASQLHRLRPRSERVSEEEVKESSLNRIRSKSTKGGMAIISAARGDKSKKENKKRDTKLGKRFPGSTRVKGKYTEKDDKTGKERTVSEPSRVVTSGKLGKRKFAKKVKKAGKDYGQDSVLIQKKPKGSATLHATRKGGLGKDKRIKAGKFRAGRSNEYGHSEVKGKKFTYEAAQTMQRQNGLNLCVSLIWRGRYYTPQFFFPSLKKPSRQDVQDAAQKIYPGCKVNTYYEHPFERDQPIIKLPEQKNIAESLIRHMKPTKGRDKKETPKQFKPTKPYDGGRLDEV